MPFGFPLEPAFGFVGIFTKVHHTETAASSVMRKSAGGRGYESFLVILKKWSISSVLLNSAGDTRT